MSWLGLDRFASRGVGKGPTSYCRDCQSIYCKKHYLEHKSAHNKRRYGHQKGIRRLNTERIRQYLLGKCCIDCGESDLCVLEFDHVRGVKTSDIASMCAEGYGWPRIEEELGKCDIRCANCHRRKTAKERRWWRSVGT
jgi:hypothetical protein